MKEITVMNRISKIIENINYKSVYLEIHTNTDKYIIEKENRKQIGFINAVKEK